MSISQRGRRTLLASLIVLSICSGQTQASEDGAGEPNVRWLRSEISVCWGNQKNYDQVVETKSSPLIYRRAKYHPLPHSDREKIRILIQKEFSHERTWVHFTGWQDCKDTTDSDITILTSDDHPDRLYQDKIWGDLFNKTTGHAPIGQWAFDDKDSQNPGYHKRGTRDQGLLFLRKLTYDKKLKITPTQDLLMTALHEFGHVAGLSHEHARSQAKADYNCQITQTSLREVQYSTTKNYGYYDANSIMNYCFQTAIRRISGLQFTSAPLATPIRLTDRTIYSSSDGIFRRDYTIRIGLSRGDVAALKAIYEID